MHPSKQQIQELRRQGFSYRRIGRRFGLSHERIRQIDKDIIKLRSANRAIAHIVARAEREARLFKYQQKRNQL